MCDHFFLLVCCIIQFILVCFVFFIIMFSLFLFLKLSEKDDMKRKFCPVGKLLPGVYVAIMDDDLKPLPVALPGEVNSACKKVVSDSPGLGDFADYWTSEFCS